MKFQWDAKKAADTLKNHGISFDEAATVFGDPLAATIPDPEHSSEEARFVTMGQTASQRLVMLTGRGRQDH